MDEPLREDVDVHLDARRELGGGGGGLVEGGHEVLGQIDVLEHALELVGELAAALRLQLGDHAPLRVDGRRLAQQQPATIGRYLVR